MMELLKLIAFIAAIIFITPIMLILSLTATQYLLNLLF